MKVRFRNQAFADLLGIHRWIAREDTRAADEVIVRILAGVERLGVFPGIGRRGTKPHVREWLVRGLPYVIVYRGR